MVSEAVGGTGTITTDATEKTVVDLTTNKFFGGFIDLTNMAGTDSVTIREFHKIKSAGSYILANSQIKTGPQTNDLLEFPMKPNNHGYKITIQRTAGTDRAYDFEFFEV